ncbi:MAG: hypothetical protein H7Z43_11065 [Clostridia bacterium]|nr:hypothetical protein [Deltaproteobacteria bacterium]
MQISAFGEDATNGDLYGIFLNSDFQGAKIARFEQVPADPGTVGGPPLYLSQTGCFDPSFITQPVEDLIPYETGAQFWSDGATKRRWFSVPDATTVALTPDGDFLWPNGTMLVKEFALNDKKVETRFMVKQVENGRWAGYSYAWNDAQSDATLVKDSGDSKVWDAQTWFYPGRSQCFQCHTDIANTSLGLETAQLNHDMTYEATAITANQINTLIHIGVVDASVAPPPYPDLPYITDITRSVEERARGYLHANCSGCHRPEGPTFVAMDLRYDVTFADMKICNASPQISDMEDIIPNNPRLLSPGDPSRSQIYQRMLTSGTYRMPAVGRTLPDQEALAVLGAWITSVTACP